MREVDFTKAELKGAVFDDCDLKNAIFQQANLERVDFRTALHLAINPENNRLRKARFSKEGVMWLLKKHDIIVN